MKNYKIALDCDDVIINFYGHLCKTFKQPELQINIWDGKKGGEAEWVADKFPDLFNHPSFWSSAPPLNSPNSINFDFDCYVTSFPEEMYDLRKKWLKDNGFPDKPLYCTGTSKIEKLIELGIDVLVDDKPLTIQQCYENNIVGIRYIPSYMSDKSDYGHNITHLSEVPKILENLNK